MSVSVSVSPTRSHLDLERQRNELLPNGQSGEFLLRRPSGDLKKPRAARVVYYVAQSLDGYIATSAGGVEWLPAPETADHGDSNPTRPIDPEDFGYAEFYDGVGGIVMGAGTYEFIMGSGADWPYTSVPVVVMTTRRFPTHPGPPGMVRFRAAAPRAVVAELRAELARSGASDDAAIWLVGGGELAASFAASELIDEFQIAVVPVLLGRGVPLIESVVLGRPSALRWLETRAFPAESGGVLLHVYERLREES